MSNSNKDACPRWISFGLRFHRSREGWYSFLPTNGSCRFLRSTLLQTKPKRKRSRDLNAATKATCELRRRLRFVSRDGIVAMGMQTMDVRLSIFCDLHRFEHHSLEKLRKILRWHLHPHGSKEKYRSKLHFESCSIGRQGWMRTDRHACFGTFQRRGVCVPDEKSSRTQQGSTWSSESKNHARFRSVSCSFPS